ncbi:hypothetical protein [Polyangium jinanense]|uniref:Uncharacterized protein n=1 Tax=Polyangium jinanense TaxID=2829994 RepID=A0A9X3WZ46_9BACT|nr:hypothetical protein [Polyangium jinanense]MDC3953260.1 hypothetical protein [Polyangium jinanense]MDC3979620.1 hypothetical protein [Polyangium jinanense]
MAYRDDEHALQTKKADIEARLAQIEEQRRELEGLSREEAELGKALADVERRLEERRRLPLLSQVQVAAPCPADWNKMVGDEHARFCPSCEKNVYNLSAMTGQEAEQLIREKEGNLCVRYFQRKDGTVMTSDCPVGVRKRRVRRSVAAGVVVAVAGAGAVSAVQFARNYETMLIDERFMRVQHEPKADPPAVAGQVTPEQFLMWEAEEAGKKPVRVKNKITEKP